MWTTRATRSPSPRTCWRRRSLQPRRPRPVARLCGHIPRPRRTTMRARQPWLRRRAARPPACDARRRPARPHRTKTRTMRASTLTRLRTPLPILGARSCAARRESCLRSARCPWRRRRRSGTRRRRLLLSPRRNAVSWRRRRRRLPLLLRRLMGPRRQRGPHCPRAARQRRRHRCKALPAAAPRRRFPTQSRRQHRMALLLRRGARIMARVRRSHSRPRVRALQPLSTGRRRGAPTESLFGRLMPVRAPCTKHRLGAPIRSRGRRGRQAPRRRPLCRVRRRRRRQDLKVPGRRRLRRTTTSHSLQRRRSRSLRLRGPRGRH